MTRPIRTLLFSTLYPSSSRPNHGIFVETRLRELLKTGAVETRVVAPVPWFPSTHPRFGEWAQMASTPIQECRNGIEVWHPRYLLPPKVGMLMAPLSLALCALGTVLRLRRGGYDFDVIDAHYYYPDGVAAALISRLTGKPLVITARGTDLNLLPRYTIPRALIRWAGARASASIGVCRALVDVLGSLGVDPSHLHVFRNGVDLERFHPCDGSGHRHALGLDDDEIFLLSVGHLIERKGHDIVIRALPLMRERGLKVRLAVVGSGPMRAPLEELVATLGLQHQVTFVGSVANAELAGWYSAADYLVLASSREGWANVLLESLACGTPVLASNIWGTPEVVREPVAGSLFEPRTPQALADSLATDMRRARTVDEVRQYAEGFSWADTSAAQVRLFESLLPASESPSEGGGRCHCTDNSSKAVDRRVA